MEQSRLRKLRRKRLMLNAIGYLLGLGLWILTLYARLPIFSVLFLFIAGMIIVEDILRWKFKTSNPINLFSVDMRELEEYEVTHLNKKQTELIKSGRIIKYVIVAAMLWLAYSLRHHGILRHANLFDTTFPPFPLGYPLLFWFISLTQGMAADYKLDRVAGQPPSIPIEMDREKLKRARRLNGIFFGGTLLFLFTTLFLIVGDWLKSDAAFFLTGAVALLIPMLTYLFTGRLNPYSFFIPRLREYTEWRKGELGDDWNWNQKVGFVGSLLTFVVLLVYAYWNRGGHDWVVADIWDMFFVYFFLFPCWLGFRVVGLKLDRALLPLEEKKEETV